MKRFSKLALIGVVILGAAAGCTETTTVQESGGRKLSMTRPSRVTIKQGTTQQVKVSIQREKFTDAVAVKIDKLPAGVTVVEKRIEIPGNDTSATFSLKADDNAAVVANHDATVTVTGPGILQDTETLPITVNKKN